MATVVNYTQNKINDIIKKININYRNVNNKYYISINSYNLVLGENDIKNGEFIIVNEYNQKNKYKMNKDLYVKGIDYGIDEIDTDNIMKGFSIMSRIYHKYHFSD